MRQPLEIPSTIPLNAKQRDAELERICSGFVAPGQANRQIYRVLLECLLPPGAGVPGPVVTENDLRAAVNALKPGYKDVFRRVRELQGEEGVNGIIKQGTRYQLTHLAVAAKREPRRPISVATAQRIALAQGSRCTVCGNPVAIAGAKRKDVDHRVPRKRGGTSYEGNLQVLCAACNIAKSTQCTNCSLDCNSCGWAFPELYRPIKLRPNIIQRLNALARDKNQDVDQLANDLLNNAMLGQ